MRKCMTVLTVSLGLLLAVGTAGAGVKNVIVMISDGWGQTGLDATAYWNGERAGYEDDAGWNVCGMTNYMYHEGGQPGLVYGGSQALESLGGYLVARAWVRNEADLRATLRALGWAIFVAALIALPETLLGQIFTHDLLRAITGYYHPIGIEQRLGLTRAYGVFDHPIHYGTFCATMAPSSPAFAAS